MSVESDVSLVMMVLAVRHMQSLFSVIDLSIVSQACLRSVHCYQTKLVC